MRTYRHQATLAFTVAALWLNSASAIPIMHVHDQSGRLGTVDVATGNVSLVGLMNAVMTDIAFSPSGELFGITFNSLYAIDAATAAVTFIGSHGIPGGNALVFATDGTLYGAGRSSTSLYTVDPTSGATTNLGNTNFASGGDLAFYAGDLYLASNTNQLAKLDLTDPSASTTVGPFGMSNVFGLAVGNDNNMYGVAGSFLFTVDPLTGATSNTKNFGGQGLSVAFGQSFFFEASGEQPPEPPPPAPPGVPEPSSLGLLVLGLGGLYRAKKRTTTTVACIRLWQSRCSHTRRPLRRKSDA